MDEIKSRGDIPKQLSGVYLVLEKLEEYPNKECDWQTIYTFLKDHSGDFNKSMRYNIKNALIKDKFVEFDEETKKIKKLKDFYDKSIDEAIPKTRNVFHNLRTQLTKFFIETFENEIMTEEESITFNVSEFSNYTINDLTKKLQKDVGEQLEQKTINIGQLYNCGMFDLIDFLEEDPVEAVQIIKECYETAYYTIKTENAKYQLNICGLPEVLTKTKSGKPFTIENINSNSIGKIIEFEGEIIMTSPIKSALKNAVYKCRECGGVKKEEIENPFLMQFEPICPKCAQQMTLIEDESEYINFQEIVVQQPFATMSNHDAEPKPLSVFIENQDAFYTGTVRVTGIPIRIQKNKKIPLGEICVKSLNVSQVTNQINIKLEKEDIESIEKVVKELNKYSISPALYFGKKLMYDIEGYENIKKAAILQQIRGIPLTKNGKKRRHICHIMLVGDPGNGKSQVLRSIGRIPGNMYISATTTSEVGLIAALQKTESKTDGGQYRVSIGPLPRANGGSCCIDEIGTNIKLQEAMLTPLEDMKGTINKATIHTEVPTETAVIAACNPKHGRFDPELSIFEQINMTPQFLSRYDMVFAIVDNNSDESRNKIVDKILDLYGDDEDDNEYETIAGVKIDEEFIIKYIFYARNYKTKMMPKKEINEKMGPILKPYYNSLNKLHANATPRIIESAIRLSGAVAKSKLKETVGTEDLIEATELLMAAFKTIIADENGFMDFDKINGAWSNEEKEIANAIKSYIKKEQSKEGKAVFHEKIVLELTKYDDLKVERMLEKLIKSEDIFSPKFKQYMLV